ncbi:N-acetyltransferase 9-like protein [Nymphon striatum]|nr:N-acetyltransferase 9-like protein [Nymphon striatum]
MHTSEGAKEVIIDSQVYQEKGIKIETISQFHKSTSFIDESLVSNLRNPLESYLAKISEKNQPNFRYVGSIQAEQPYKKNFLFDKTSVKCKPVEDRVQCNMQEDPLKQLIQTDDSKLPQIRGFHYIFINNIGVLTAKQLNPGAVSIFARFKDLTLSVKTKRVCPSIESVSDLTGCFSCKAEAILKIVAKSHCMEGLAKVTLDGVSLFTTVVELTNKPSVISINFHSSRKCINSNVCLMANDMSICEKVDGCLNDPTIELEAANFSIVSSIAKYAKSPFDLGLGDKENRGYGFGKDVLKVFLRYANEVLNLQKAVAKILMDNKASIFLFLSLGFKEVEKIEVFKEIKYELDITQEWMKKISQYPYMIDKYK